MDEDQSPRTPLRERIKQFVTSQRGKAILLIGLFVVVLGAAGAAAYTRYFKQESDSSGGSLLPSLLLNDGPVKKPAVLTGESVEEDKAKRRPLAVMIENHPEARPQAGLVASDLVWEVIVEGGITRFMAVFSSKDVDKIGPVRSARPYFVAYAGGLKALYAHAGGSQAGLAAVSSAKEIVDLPHTAAYFHREPKPGVASEHTLFTSTKELYDFAREKEASVDADIDSFKFTNDTALEKRPASAKVGIEFSSASYNVEWTYERDSNSYQRAMGGAAHVDRVSNDQITAKNIVVVEVDRRYDGNTNQGKGEWYMTTEGSGKAQFFQNGVLIEGTWKKPKIGEMLKMYDDTGKELPLVRGNTWIEVVPPGTAITHEAKADEPAASSTTN